MPVSKEDRNDYEQGRADRDKGVIERAAIDIPVNHPDNPAYYKGRGDEPLDADNKDDKQDSAEK